MNNDVGSPDNAQPADVEYIVVHKKPSRIRRLGCGILLIFWFLFLLLPLALFILAVQGDITISRIGIPDSHEHPLLQFSLVMEADFRGLRITNTSVDHNGDNALCVQTNVRFLLWEGQGDPASFCDCYMREDEASEWQLESYNNAACD